MRALPLGHPQGDGRASNDKLRQSTLENILSEKQIVTMFRYSGGFIPLSTTTQATCNTFFVVRKPDKGIVSWVSVRNPGSTSVGELVTIVGCYQESCARNMFPDCSVSEYTVFMLKGGTVSAEYRRQQLWFTAWGDDFIIHYPFSYVERPECYEALTTIFGTTGRTEQGAQLIVCSDLKAYQRLQLRTESVDKSFNYERWATGSPLEQKKYWGQVLTSRGKNETQIYETMKELGCTYPRTRIKTLIDLALRAGVIEKYGYRYTVME